MTAENFCYWLQGMFEITGSSELDENQIQIIKDHLKLVFDKVTPDRVSPNIVPQPYPSWFAPDQCIDKYRTTITC